MDSVLSKQFRLAHKEGRLCVRCGWIVTKKNYAQGHRLCSGCRSNQEVWLGVGGHYQPIQEPIDKTGDML